MRFPASQARLSCYQSTEAMFDKLKPALSTLLHSIFNVKMTSTLNSTVTPHTLGEHIVPYCQKLALMKQNEGSQEIKKWRVASVRAYKSKATSRHEYVSAAVLDPQNRVFYFAIERGRGDETGRGDPGFILFSNSDTSSNIDPNTNLRLKTNSSVCSTSVVSFTDSISPMHSADDKITPMTACQWASGKWDKSDDLIGELIFPTAVAGKKPLYLYELAILAKEIHEVNTSYLLITNNCYHYAGTIMKVLERAYNVENTVEDSQAGKWCGLVIFSPTDHEGNISSLIGNLKKGINDFVSLVLILVLLTSTK
jgi:hypothetical protein